MQGHCQRRLTSDDIRIHLQSGFIMTHSDGAICEDFQLSLFTSVSSPGWRSDIAYNGKGDSREGPERLSEYIRRPSACWQAEAGMWTARHLADWHGEWHTCANISPAPLISLPTSRWAHTRTFESSYSTFHISILVDFTDSHSVRQSPWADCLQENSSPSHSFHT